MLLAKHTCSCTDLQASTLKWLHTTLPRQIWDSFAANSNQSKQKKMLFLQLQTQPVTSTIQAGTSAATNIFCCKTRSIFVIAHLILLHQSCPPFAWFVITTKWTLAFASLKTIFLLWSCCQNFPFLQLQKQHCHCRLFGVGRPQLEEHQTGSPLAHVCFPSAARDFSPRFNFQRRLSYSVCTPLCAIACINIWVHVKDPVVHIRVW